jgi:hypothetical protein
MSDKIDITTRYNEHEEVRTNSAPYDAYFIALKQTFDLTAINSFCDVGCATNLLLNNVIITYPHINGIGLEYFEYHIKHAPENVKDKFLICDIRDDLIFNEKYDLVNCSELAEHIDKAYADVMINNIKKLTKKYLIMTWSEHGGEYERHCDPNHQHLNPLKYNDYCALMQQHGFRFNEELTRQFLLHASRLHDFSSWWKESLVVWEL